MWIPVSVRLPESGQIVDVWHATQGRVVDCYGDGWNRGGKVAVDWMHAHWNDPVAGEITHWMERPGEPGDGSGWVAVADRLPDFGVYDVWHRGRRLADYKLISLISEGKSWRPYGRWREDIPGGDEVGASVTHWRPVPPPPDRPVS